MLPKPAGVTAGALPGAARERQPAGFGGHGPDEKEDAWRQR